MTTRYMRTEIYKIFDYFSENISYTNFEQNILPLKIISVSLSIGLIIVIIYLIFQIRKDIKNFLETIAESVTTSSVHSKNLIKGWQSVLDKLEIGDEANYKLAIIEADKIFDNLLKRIGYQGDDMGERLKQITSAQLANIDELWQAHKIRNRLVHEENFQLKEHEAKKVIEIYEKALDELEAI